MCTATQWYITYCIQTRRVSLKTLSLQQYTSRQAEGCHRANAEIKSEALKWHNDLNESGVIVECMCCFCIDLASWKDEVSLFDNRQRRRHWEKLPVHHQTWILSDDITSPGAHHRTVHLTLLSTRRSIDLLLIFHCTPVVVTEYFVIIVLILLAQGS